MTTSNIITREFDKKASEYESNRMSPWYLAHADHIFEKMSFKPGDTVLDIGCGTGYLLRQIARANPQVTGFGIDLSPRMIEVASQKAADENLGNLSFLQSDWEALNETTKTVLASQAPSHVICANAFHYFADPHKALTSMHSAMTSEGEVLLLERAKEGSILSIAWDLAHRFLIKDNVRFYDTPSIIGMLKKTQFCEVRVRLKLKKFFWKNKIYTSVALISGIKR